MAQEGALSDPSGESMHEKLMKSFGVSIRPLLAACSREDMHKAFSTLDDAQKDVSYRLLVQVMMSLHENIEVEFKSLCQEIKVGATLDMVEQLIEEHNLDLLRTYKGDFGDIKKQLSKVKKDEIRHLVGLVEKIEEQNYFMRAHVASLKETQEKQHQSITDDMTKLKGCNLNCENLFRS